MTALDVGPANGFWSFEMERRGAKVTAIELGPDDDWDAVPHGGLPPAGLSEALRSGVKNADFMTIYIPRINMLLFLAVMLLVVLFRSPISSASSAYSRLLNPLSQCAQIRS